MASLNGVAWVTGAGSGIGRACALAFAAAGAKAALTGRRIEALEETAASIRAAGGTAFVAPADVADPGAVASAHKSIVAALGDPLVLVNCAGGNVRRRHWAQLTAEAMSEVVDLDLKAMFHCTLAVLPAMRVRGDGRIVHIASQAAIGLYPVSGPGYSAAKKAVLALSATLNAEEGIHGIRSICLSPGEVDTPILNTRPSPPSVAERALMLKAEDVAEVALFCATLPNRACVTEIVLLPTDDRHVRAQAHAIAALVGA